MRWRRGAAGWGSVPMVAGMSLRPLSSAQVRFQPRAFKFVEASSTYVPSSFKTLSKDDFLGGGTDGEGGL
jgi:hypothetical protein